MTTAKHTAGPKRKRANVAAGYATFRAIHRLTKDVDWNSDVDISTIIEVARLARHGMDALNTAAIAKAEGRS